MNSIVTTAPDVFGHHAVRVAGADVDFGREHHLDVFFLGLEDGWEAGEGGHVGWFVS